LKELKTKLNELERTGCDVSFLFYIHLSRAVP